MPIQNYHFNPNLKMNIENGFHTLSLNTLSLNAKDNGTPVRVEKKSDDLFKITSNNKNSGNYLIAKFTEQACTHDENRTRKILNSDREFKKNVLILRGIKLVMELKLINKI